MSRKAFDRIARGLDEALAIAKGDLEPAKVFVPPSIDVRSIRSKLHLSQENFANSFGFTVHQVRQWEQGRSSPADPIRTYLMVIEFAPVEMRKLLQGASEQRRVKENSEPA